MMERFFFHPLGLWNRILLGSVSAIGFDQYKKHTVQYWQFIEFFLLQMPMILLFHAFGVYDSYYNSLKTICYPSGSNFCEKS